MKSSAFLPFWTVYITRRFAYFGGWVGNKCDKCYMCGGGRVGRATLQDWVLKVYGTKTDPTRPVRPSPPPTTTTASPVRNSRTWLNTSSTVTTMGSLSATGVVGPRSGHDSVARSKSGIDPSFFLSFAVVASFVVYVCFTFLFVLFFFFSILL